MRYADYAYEHINSEEHQSKDPGRAAAIDRRAENAGFSNGADYIDNVMGRPDTRSFEGADGRVAWVNAEERLTGWNHTQQPEQSTVIPARDASAAEERFEKYQETEADRLGIDREQVEERGPISEQDRQVEPEQSREEPEPEQSPEPERASARDIMQDQELEWERDRDR